MIRKPSGNALPSILISESLKAPYSITISFDGSLTLLTALPLKANSPISVTESEITTFSIDLASLNISFGIRFTFSPIITSVNVR